MADYAIPKNGVAYKCETGLIDQSNTKLLKSNPTLAAGDAKVAKDDGALANLTTLPYSTNSDKRVEVALSATEMTADNVTVIMSDVAGAEWCDQVINIQTSARGIADLAFPATSGRSMVVDANGLVDATAVKVGPSGAATAQTAGDIPARLPAALTVNGNMKCSLMEILATALTETAGQLAGGFKKFFNIAAPAATMDHGILVDTVTTLTGHTPQTGDNYAALTGANAEPGQAAPAANASILTKIAYVYKAMRNKSTQDGTNWKLYNDDNATVDQKAAVTDDGTTFTRGKIGTGP